MFEAIFSIVMFSPLVLALWFANAAEREKAAGQSGKGAAAVAIGLLAAIYALVALIGLAITIDAALGYPGLGPVLSGALTAGIDPIASEMVLGLGLLIPSVVGLLLMFVRLPDRLAGLLGMTTRRDNVVHVVALALTMLIFVNLFITLGFGLSNLATATVEEGQGASLGMVWMQCALFVALAVVGVGWLTRRNIGDSGERLGAGSFTPAQIGIGVGLGAALAPLTLLVLVAAAAVGIEPDADVEALNEALLGPLFATPIGILTIGFAAGIGEELVFRGAMQPRFGLWVTAALFAALHGNYGLSLSTLVVFMLGLVLGLARIRYSTTTTIFMHAAYNITIALLGTYASSYFEP